MVFIRLVRTECVKVAVGNLLLFILFSKPSRLAKLQTVVRVFPKRGQNNRYNKVDYVWTLNFLKVQTISRFVRDKRSLFFPKQNGFSRIIAPISAIIRTYANMQSVGRTVFQEN